jgi:hypothetical protein
MSDLNISQDNDSPRFEPWLAVMCSAFLPVIAGLYLPQWLVPMMVLAAALFGAGLFMSRRRPAARGDES